MSSGLGSFEVGRWDDARPISGLGGVEPTERPGPKTTLFKAPTLEPVTGLIQPLHMELHKTVHGFDFF